MLAISTSPAEQQQAVKEYEAALANSPTDEKSERRLGEIAFRESDMKARSLTFRELCNYNRTTRMPTLVLQRR